MWLSSEWLVFQEPCAQPEVTFLHRGGDFSCCKRTQDTDKYSFWRSLDLTLPCPTVHYCFWTASPLFLLPLPFLISYCLNLPFGIPESLGGWSLFPANKKETGDKERLLCPELHKLLPSFRNFTNRNLIMFILLNDCTQQAPEVGDSFTWHIFIKARQTIVLCVRTQLGTKCSTGTSAP